MTFLAWERWVYEFCNYAEGETFYDACLGSTVFLLHAQAYFSGALQD